MTSEKPRRRWFQFSLRSLFVAVTLAGLASPFIPQAIAGLFLPPKVITCRRPTPQRAAQPAANSTKPSAEHDQTCGE